MKRFLLLSLILAVPALAEPPQPKSLSPSYLRPLPPKQARKLFDVRNIPPPMYHMRMGAAMISGEAAGDIQIGKPFTADNSPKPALIRNRGRQTLTTYRSEPYEINIMTPDRNSTLKRFTVYNSLDVLTESPGHGIKSVVRQIRVACGLPDSSMRPGVPGYALIGPSGSMSIGDHQEEILKQWTKARPVARYRSEGRDNAWITVYDDVADGVAFEMQELHRFEEKRTVVVCAGYILHAKGKPVQPMVGEQWDDWQPIAVR